MNKTLLLFFCLLNFQVATICQISNPYFQQKVDYKIDVTLNDAENTLDGYEMINYTNNSPDTLLYIWFHLWPNAYKNDRTAFCEQLLQLGRTDFYSSNNDERGYINRLDFKVEGITAQLEDHPLYIDVARLILPEPLPPGRTIKITTPFHEKIPFNFSRGGHVGNTYQITQWYPKPAVYDNAGWHPMPYLDQGEFYSEFGNFNVSITLPKDYVVAATGELRNEGEKEFLLAKSKQLLKNELLTTLKTPSIKNDSRQINKKPIFPQNRTRISTAKNTSSTNEYHNILNKDNYKTLHYQQDSVHDFAWFADKNYLVRYDTMMLPSGKIIDAWSFFTRPDIPVWEHSIDYIKSAVRTRGSWLGEYPYKTVSAAEGKMGVSGGMEYPTITCITPLNNKKSLEMTVEHEVGHNWNYGILANNEREYPWMDEGMNTYFDNRYSKIKFDDSSEKKEEGDFIENKIPLNKTDLIYRTAIAYKKDQPIETNSENFSGLNYGLSAYYKAGIWMKVLENFVGEPLFDSCLHQYFEKWKFKHPTPQDFKRVVEDVSGKNVDSIFSLLQDKGNIEPELKKDIKISALFNFRNTNKHHYVFLSPALGFNYYDKVMVGALFHNYTLPEPAFDFLAAPMFATGSNTFTGIGRIGYNILSYGLIRKTEFSLSGEKFTMDEYTDSAGIKNYMGFSKLVPAIKIIFRNKSAISTIEKSVQWKTYFIRETGLLFTRDTVTQTALITYPKSSRYLNQLQARIENHRALYPYSGELQAEQAQDFVRLAFEGKYFFNYPKGGGMNVRIFGGKFIYLGDKTVYKEFETDRYHLNMTGANGNEDYTYSNYFIGRNEFQGGLSQQIMIRDGGFKVRSDLLANKIGKTDNWLAAANFQTDIPKQFNPLQLLPIKIPLKLFLDAGTYAEAWEKNAPTGKFIYDAGFQIPLLKGMINIYIPVLYSKVYTNYFKSTLSGNRFWKEISFSIDIQNFSFSKFFNQPAP